MRELNILIAVAIKLAALFIGKRGIQNAHVDQIKWIRPGPFLQDIIYLEDTIRRHPGNRRGEEIHATNGR